MIMKRILTAAAWVAGLLIAGSDGPFFPYINVIGLGLFLIANIRLSRDYA